MKSKFLVEGLAGRRLLRGRLPVRGAKNAALKGLASSALFSRPPEYENLPQIEDVKRMQELLAHARRGGEYDPAMDGALASSLRASVVLTGPLLARCGEVFFPLPGGDVIGDRPIDLFLDGYRAMGASVSEEGGSYRVRGALRGTRIFFPFVSVTATETLMMAATLARGQTVLENAAMEPEIADLAHFLNECGARISGAGTPTITIEGGGLLEPKVAYETPPDRIEAGSFVILAALAGSDITVTSCDPKQLGAFLELMHRAGVELEVGERSIRVRGAGSYKAVSVRTHEYPGFPTDLQAPMAVLLTQMRGQSTILETIFDGRFGYTDALVRMGADVTVMNPHKILVRGPRPLVARELESPDIRAGLAYLLAATVAEGTSNIGNAYVIDRGYERIEERLKPLGLNIRREEE